MGGGEFQVATGLGIEHQGFAAVHDRRHIQGNPGVLLQGLGVVHVMQQPPEGAQGQGQFREAETIEAGQLVVGSEGLLGLGGTEGCAGHGAEAQALGAPRGSRGFGAVAITSPEQFRGLELGQLLMQAVAARALHHSHITGAHIGTGQSPTQRRFSGGGLPDHGRQPIVAAGAAHAFLQHGAGGEHAGDAAFEQGALGGGCFQLIAEGHRIAAADQLGAVALSGVMGNAGHRHAPDCLATVLAGEGELQNPGEFNSILKKAFKEITKPIKKDALGMLSLELHVMAQHWRELGRIHLAVVSPGGFVAAGVVVAGAFGGWVCALVGALLALLALAGPGGGIGAEAGVAEVFQLGCSRLDGTAFGGFSGFRIPEQASLKGLRVGLGSGARHRTVHPDRDRTDGRLLMSA